MLPRPELVPLQHLLVEQLGPGAWTIRVSVVDVDAKATDLATRDTPCSLDGGVLRASPEATLGVPFEFVTT